MGDFGRKKSRNTRKYNDLGDLSMKKSGNTRKYNGLGVFYEKGIEKPKQTLTFASKCLQHLRKYKHFHTN